MKKKSCKDPDNSAREKSESDSLKSQVMFILDEYGSIFADSVFGFPERDSELEFGPLFEEIDYEEMWQALYFQQRSSLLVSPKTLPMSKEIKEFVQAFRETAGDQAIQLASIVQLKGVCPLPNWWIDLLHHISNHENPEIQEVVRGCKFTFSQRLSLMSGIMRGKDEINIILSLLTRSFFQNALVVITSSFFDYTQETGFIFSPRHRSAIQPILTVHSRLNASGLHPGAIPCLMSPKPQANHMAFEGAHWATKFILYHELAHAALHGQESRHPKGYPLYLSSLIAGVTEADDTIFVDCASIDRFKSDHAKELRLLLSKDISTTAHATQCPLIPSWSDLSASDVDELEADSWALDVLWNEAESEGIKISGLIFGVFCAVLFTVIQSKGRSMSGASQTGASTEINNLSLARIARLRSHFGFLCRSFGMLPEEVRFMEEVVRMQASMEYAELPIDGHTLVHKENISMRTTLVRFETLDKTSTDNLDAAAASYRKDFISDQNGIILEPSGRLTGFGLGEYYDLAVSIGNSYYDDAAIAIVANTVYELCKAGIRRLVVGGKEVPNSKNEIEEAVRRALEDYHASDDKD